MIWDLRRALAWMRILPCPWRYGGCHTECGFGRCPSCGRIQQIPAAKAIKS